MEKAYQLEFSGKKTGSLFLNCCGMSRTEPFHSFGPAIKPHYLIHFILNGKGRFSIGGKEYLLERGCGFLIPPEELAFYQADEQNPWTYVWVGFYGSMARELISSMGLSATSPVFQSDKEEEFYQAVTDMMEHNTFGIANELRRNGQLQLFLSLIAESAHIEEKGEADKADNYVRRATEFILSNYCNPIKVTDVADYVCINRSYLYTLFKNAMGISPQQFLTTFRISKAQELLELTSLPIESIALSCGYSDPLVFAKSFKQIKKMSPSAYRKEMQKGETRKNKEQLKQIEDFINKINEING
ncbi:AraC family transcriptional regulator [Parablautia intestinalis]|uniref:AraC family transcriptional regulator n=1 Tax=Parablautia intestinalis TaxID=2320100 RepID=A0A3A9AHF2_9FIRM|nr:AraC family transcriptional regulator [Parablautia intestinalis]MDE7046612.1 AraC family transcriptional regulator [Lachnospiraceae bacterium]RKI90912.1 AraC family transcriptional regulator [Parablautia intestinalis]